MTALPKLIGRAGIPFGAMLRMAAIKNLIVNVNAGKQDTLKIIEVKKCTRQSPCESPRRRVLFGSDAPIAQWIEYWPPKPVIQVRIPVGVFLSYSIRNIYRGLFMGSDALLTRISIDPNVCFGKPCIRGHRLCVSLILDLLASGLTADELLKQYPSITILDIRACIAFAAEMTRER